MPAAAGSDRSGNNVVEVLAQGRDVLLRDFAGVCDIVLFEDAAKDADEDTHVRRGVFFPVVPMVRDEFLELLVES